MAYTNYDKYLEAEVLTADPLKLVMILYRAAIDAVAAARRHLAAGDIRKRSRQITKAWKLVNELRESLRESLDDRQGAELSRSLRELYAYMQRRLLEANATQTDEPLAEVGQLLATLHQGWSSIAAAPAADEEAYEPLSCTY